MPNRFNNIYDNQYVSTYVPLPFEEIAAVGAMKQKTQDTAAAEREAYLAKNWNRLSQDADSARKLKANLDSKLDTMANKDHSDPQVKAEWYRMRREMANEFGPDGAAGAQEANYNTHVAYVKDLDAKLAKGPKEGGIDKQTYDDLINYSLSRYKGIGEKGLSGYNQYKPEAAAGYFDLAGAADELAKGWKENKKATEGWSEDPDGRLFRKRGGEVEYITEKEIYDNIVPQLKANPMAQSFVAQDIKLNGMKLTPEEQQQMDLNKTYDSYFNRAGTFAANKYGYRQTKQTEDIQQNGFARDAARKKLEDPQTTTITAATGDTSGNGVKLGGEEITQYFKPNSDGSSSVDWDKVASSLQDPEKGKQGWLSTLIQDKHGMSKGPVGNGKITAAEVKTKVESVAKVLGLDKGTVTDPKTGQVRPLDEVEVMEKTMNYLQNASISAPLSYQPDLETAKAVTAKIDQQFDKNKMFTSGEGKQSYADLKADAGEFAKDIKFQGLDFTDKTNPRMVMEIPDKDGKPVTHYMNIPNETYKKELKDLATANGYVTDMLMGNITAKGNPTTGRKPAEDIKLASDLVVKMDPKVLEQQFGRTKSQLSPLSVLSVKGKTVFVYADNTVPGGTKAIAFDNDPSKAPVFYNSFSTYMKDENGDFYNSHLELKSKVKKDIDYND